MALLALMSSFMTTIQLERMIFSESVSPMHLEFLKSVLNPPRSVLSFLTGSLISILLLTMAVQCS